jgi:hypothetical protein
MTRLYRWHTFWNAGEVSGFLQSGSPVTVTGRPMVDTGNSIEPANGWHASKPEALTAGAIEIETTFLRLAVKLRKEAADAVE